MTTHWSTLQRCAVLLVALSAVACGHKQGSSAPGASSAAAKKVFTINRTDAFKTLDPMKQYDQASSEILQNVCDTLLRYDYLKRPYQLAPDLLTQMPQLSADGLTYSFELRKDVRFNDDVCFPGGKGRALVADDVVYSLKRFADANVNVLSYTLLAGMIEGMDAFREQTTKLGKAADYQKLAIGGITKLDEQHFTIKLTQKNPLALFPLAAAPLSIVPHEAIEHYKDEFDQHPVGSGPFLIKQMSRRGVIVLVKNPHYHLTYPTEGMPGDAETGLLAAAGKSLPLIDEVRLPLIEEPQPAMLQFLDGGIDWVAIDRDNFAKMAFKDASGYHLKPEYKDKFVIYAEPDLSAEYFAFNMKDPLVGKNAALREAFAYALDTPAFIEQMYNGRGEPLHTIVPLGIAGSERDVPSKGYEHDIAMAKKKLAEAGYPGGKGLPPITIEYRASNTFTRQHFEFTRAQLAEAGITVLASFQTFSAFLKRIESGNFQIVENGWAADYPDAENFYQLLYGPNRTPGPNQGSYDNPEYNKLYEQIRFMPSGPQRFALFARMNEILRRDLPAVVTFNVARVGFIQPWVKNFRRNIMLDKPFMYFDVDLALKAKKGPH
jgi:oligopeptide transport system substrate-binding protein